MAAQHLGGVVGLELQKVGAIDQARDDLAHVIRLAFIGGHDAQQLLFVVQGLGKMACGGHRVPIQLVHDFPGHANGVGIVLAQVFTQTGDLGMGLGAAEFFVGALLANRGLDQRRAGQVDAGAPAHQDHVVRQARQVGATGGRRPMYHGNLGQAHGRHAGLVGKGASAFDEDFTLVQQVRAATFNQ